MCWWCGVLVGTDVLMVWCASWNWCVDGVVCWLELMCWWCGVLVGTDVLMVWCAGWNWCVDGVVCWLEQMCWWCGVLVGTYVLMVWCGVLVGTDVLIVWSAGWNRLCISHLMKCVINTVMCLLVIDIYLINCGPGSWIGIGTDYVLGGPG